MRALLLILLLIHSSLADAQSNRYCKDKLVDSDGDFVTDCDEFKKFKTNPKKKDSNKNGIPDGDEDKNKNGIQNEDEDDKAKNASRIKGNKDRDQDCLQDEDENDFGLSIKNPDSNGNGIVDGLEDSDGDGILNKDEDDRPGEGTTDEDIRCGQPPATATPTPAPENTASPTPTLDPNANFDFSGNVTSIGKVNFGIPSYLSANLLRGYNAHSNFSCTGCHVERGGYSYSQLVTGTSQDPMNTFGLTEQDLADITAWLNRGERLGKV